jgi:hypothetical protein
MTRGGALLDDDGLLSIKAFEVVMKDQVKRFVQRQLTNILAIGRCSDAEEVQLSTMKAILHEQVKESTQRFCSLVFQLLLNLQFASEVEGLAFPCNCDCNAPKMSANFAGKVALSS